MKITIDLDNVRDFHDEAFSTPSVPLPPPAELLKRAKALGAISAGAANLGFRGVVSDLDVVTDVAPTKPRKTPTKRATRKRGR